MEPLQMIMQGDYYPTLLFDKVWGDITDEEFVQQVFKKR